MHIVPDYYDILNLKTDVLENPPPKLELFGYGAQIRPIGRDPHTGAAVVRPRWSYPKVYFRTADDYGNDDWEWLLRHHGYDEDEHCGWRNHCESAHALKLNNVWTVMHNADAFR